MYFPVVRFIILYKVMKTLKKVGTLEEILSVANQEVTKCTCSFSIHF